MSAEASRPYVMGETDCASICARWVEYRAGVNPLEHYGRTDLENWISEPGGLPAAVRRVMRKAGFIRTKSPKPGDVAVLVGGGVLADGPTPEAAVINSMLSVVAIRGESSWLWRAKGAGLCSGSALMIEPYYAWSIECLKSSRS